MRSLIEIAVRINGNEQASVLWDHFVYYPEIARYIDTAVSIETAMERVIAENGMKRIL